jgi:hypothetical protein
MFSKETVRRFGIERRQSRIQAETRPAVGTVDRVRPAHIDVDVRMSWGGDTPMHSNSLTPMQISETQRSFLNFRIDSSYYGTVDMEKHGLSEAAAPHRSNRVHEDAAGVCAKLTITC